MNCFIECSTLDLIGLSSHQHLDVDLCAKLKNESCKDITAFFRTEDMPIETDLMFPLPTAEFYSERKREHDK